MELEFSSYNHCKQTNQTDFPVSPQELTDFSWVTQDNILQRLLNLLLFFLFPFSLFLFSKTHTLALFLPLPPPPLF